MIWLRGELLETHGVQLTNVLQMLTLNKMGIISWKYGIVLAYHMNFMVQGNLVLGKGWGLKTMNNQASWLC